MSFNFNTGDPFADQSQNEISMAQPGIKDMYEQGNPQMALDFQSSTLVPKLKSMGISTDNLNFSPVGRMQLLSRLQQNLGSGYLDHPDSKELLNNFDGLAKQQNMDGQKSYIEQASKAQKTLEALYKG